MAGYPRYSNPYKVVDPGVYYQSPQLLIASASSRGEPTEQDKERDDEPKIPFGFQPRVPGADDDPGRDARMEEADDGHQGSA